MVREEEFEGEEGEDALNGEGAPVNKISIEELAGG